MKDLERAMQVRQEADALISSSTKASVQKTGQGLLKAMDASLTLWRGEYETFRRMGLTDKDLRPSNTVFHGVVPGKSAYPVGKIALDVAFGHIRRINIVLIILQLLRGTD